jgi:hypothetical protein
MIPILKKILRAAERIAAALGRLQEKAEVIFLSKNISTRRAAQRLEARQRKEWKVSEVERLDRIRNPSDYLGK